MFVYQMVWNEGIFFGKENMFFKIQWKEWEGNLHILKLIKYPSENSKLFWVDDNTIQYNTIQYNTVQYDTLQYNTVQYNTTQYITRKRIPYITCIT